MSTIKSSAENLTLNADGSGNDIKFQSNASEVAEITDGGVISSTGGSTHADNVKAKFGTGNDLEIYHDASHSFISDQGTGSLKILANTLEINNAANNEAMAGFTQDGAVTLYHNDVAKFETIAGGSRIPSGGLLFGSDTAAANALNDYEEGTWTPTFNGSHIGSHTLNYATYTKIGRLVTINCYVYNFGSIGGSGVSFGIQSLPFAQDHQATGTAGGSYYDINASYGHTVARGYIGTIYLEQLQDNGSSVWLDYGRVGANTHVQISLAYETNA